MTPPMDWTGLVFLAIDWSWFLLGLLCLGWAGLLAVDRPPKGMKISWRVMAVLPALLAAYNLARYRVFYLTGDSAVTANLAWSAAHGFGLRSLILGDRSYLGAHLSLVLYLLAPLSRLWDGTAVLAAAQGLALGTAPLALFALARRLAPGSPVPWLAFLLAAAHPCFRELAGTVLDASVFALPLLLWAACAFEAGRPKLGILAAAAALSTREQAPLVAFGAGACLYVRGPSERRRAAAAIMGASAVLFALELKAMALARAADSCFDNWRYFANLGGSPRAISELALRRPWTFAAAFARPAEKLLPPLGILAHCAFLPFADGPGLLAALVPWIPHQLAPAGSHFQALRTYYSAFVMGPLLWSMVHGLVRIEASVPGRLRARLSAVLLLVAAWGFLSAPRFHDPGRRVVPAAWRSAAPKALALIPSRAKVWCDGYLLPQLAMRRYIKGMPTSFSGCSFRSGLFVPDFVLLSTYWMRTAPPEVVSPVMRLFEERGFRTVFGEADLVLLANPRPSAPDAPPEALQDGWESKGG